VEAVSASTTYVRIAAISLGILAKDPSLRGLALTLVSSAKPVCEANSLLSGKTTGNFYKNWAVWQKSRPSERSKLS
jgi:hypothetical protein